MYVRIKSQPTISQVYNTLKNWQHPEKSNKNDNHFFIVILLFQMLWLNEYFLSIIFYRLDLQGKNIREEPKGIVFLSKLLLLFQFCHLCLFSKPKLSVSQTGTLLTVESFCRNCGQTKVWKSQPDLLGKFPAGNLLLSFAVLCAGASIWKVVLVFRHMGILAYHEPTYYYHQRHLLIPSIVSFWRKYQTRILETLKNKEVVVAGNGRHDSMGHSAKFGTYTIFLLHSWAYHPHCPCAGMILNQTV